MIIIFANMELFKINYDEIVKYNKEKVKVFLNLNLNIYFGMK